MTFMNITRLPFPAVLCAIALAACTHRQPTTAANPAAKPTATSRLALLDGAWGGEGGDSVDAIFGIFGDSVFWVHAMEWRRHRLAGDSLLLGYDNDTLRLLILKLDKDSLVMRESANEVWRLYRRGE